MQLENYIKETTVRQHQIHAYRHIRNYYLWLFSFELYLYNIICSALIWSVRLLVAVAAFAMWMPSFRTRHLYFSDIKRMLYIYAKWLWYVILYVMWATDCTLACLCVGLWRYVLAECERRIIIDCFIYNDNGVVVVANVDDFNSPSPGWIILNLIK